MRNRRMTEVRPEAGGDTSGRRIRILRRVAQLVAPLVFGGTVGAALATSYPADHLAFSPDGPKLVGTVNGYLWPMPNDPGLMYGVIKVWDVDTGEELAR